jgi:S-adenosylmethionine synthetase
LTTSIKSAKTEFMRSHIFTSESVSEGHPDKICDRISDAVVDAFYKLGVENGTADQTRVACETATTTNHITLLGEFRGDFEAINFEKLVRGCVKDIGYEQKGFHHATLKMYNLLHAQSAQIAQGVDQDGAGDQGIMFGYATNETPQLMPAPIQYSHDILRVLADERKHGSLKSILGPDAKSQLSVQYDANGKPVGVTSIVLSTQHLNPSLSSNEIEEIVRPHILEVLPEGWVTSDTEWHVNPTGAFVIGGPDGDAGLTGRKIIVDTYGGAAPHGGGAFSGKDSTKVDRSAAYAARYLAKNIVAAGLAEKCTIQLSYAIGVAQPQSVYVKTHGTGAIDEAELETFIMNNFDLSPRGIRNMLELNKPIYERTAAYGHFGREPDQDGGFSWERTDDNSPAAKILKSAPKPMV